MSDAVLDSSAVLALLQDEPGSGRVKACLPGALISSVNVAEIISKLCERGMPPDAARLATEAIGVEIVEFDLDQACLTGALRPATRSLGLSLGDRACLALARLRDLPAITCDRAWHGVEGSDVVFLR